MDQLIKSFQDYLKSSILGISFAGASDGYMSPTLKTALSSLQNIIKDKLSKSPNKENQDKAKTFAVLSGDKIVTTVDEVKKIIDNLSKESAPNQNIKAAQEVFNSNPFGLNYTGLKDGVMSPEFSSKLKELEKKIAEVTGAQIAGKIIAGENLVTDANDLSKTFSLIKSYQEFANSQKK